MTATPATTAAAYRSALGSVVKGTVAIGTIFDVASDSISMLGSFVKEHADRQKVTHAVEREIWLETLEHDTSIRLAEVAVQAQTYCSKSTDHAKFYEAANSRIDRILKSYRPSNTNTQAEPSE